MGAETVPATSQNQSNLFDLLGGSESAPTSVSQPQSQPQPQGNLDFMSDNYLGQPAEVKPQVETANINLQTGF